MSLDTVKNIIKDLSKIEYALRIENVDSKINNALGIVIIELYRHSILYSDSHHDITADKLFDVYSVMSHYSKLENPEYQSLVDDIIVRIKKVVERRT